MTRLEFPFFSVFLRCATVAWLFFCRHERMSICLSEWGGATSAYAPQSVPDAVVQLAPIAAEALRVSSDAARSRGTGIPPQSVESGA